MVGFARKNETELECPFCGKGRIRTFYREGYMQAHISRISGKSATRSHKRDEMYEILEDCPSCGAKKKDIQDYYDGKYKKKISHEERIAMLKKRGLPLVLGSKR